MTIALKIPFFTSSLKGVFTRDQPELLTHCNSQVNFKKQLRQYVFLSNRNLVMTYRIDLFEEKNNPDHISQRGQYLVSADQKHQQEQQVPHSPLSLFSRTKMTHGHLPRGLFPWWQDQDMKHAISEE